jgi:hypothetical protein
MRVLDRPADGHIAQSSCPLALNKINVTSSAREGAARIEAADKTEKKNGKNQPRSGWLQLLLPCHYQLLCYKAVPRFTPFCTMVFAIASMWNSAVVRQYVQ